MSTLDEMRYEILDALFEKNSSDKISWQYNESDKSAQSDLGTFQVHFDRKLIGGRPSYKVWIISENGDASDSFSIAEASLTDRGKEMYKNIHAIFTSVRDASIIEKISPVLSMLKKL